MATPCSAAVPSAALLLQGFLHDTASPYAHKVHFTIYTIKDTSRQLGPWRERGACHGSDAPGQFASKLAPQGTIAYSHAVLSACRISARTKAVPPIPSTRVQHGCHLLGLCRCAGINFDLESFKQQLTRLAMPHQQFTFGQVRTLGGSRHAVLAQYLCHTEQPVLESQGACLGTAFGLSVRPANQTYPCFPPCFPPFAVCAEPAG